MSYFFSLLAIAIKSLELTIEILFFKLTEEIL